MQTLPEQSPLVQSVFTLQTFPGAQAGQVPPPQSTSVSFPFVTASEQVGAAQKPFAQTPLVQMLPAVQELPVEQLAVHTQTAAMQVELLEHFVPHLPQLLGSV